MSAAERASEASIAEQANEWAVRANERTDERVAQYFSMYVMMQDQEDKPTHSLSKINIGLEVMWLFFVKDQGV